MELNEFRIMHSTLIEHYQYMEGHLEGIYGAISDEPFLVGVRTVEKDSLGEILREIRRLEKDKDIEVFTREEHEQLQLVFQRRNFWCHNCYFDMVFDRKTGGPAKVRDVHQLLQDMKDAEAWRERLFERKLQWLEKKWQKNKAAEEAKGSNGEYV